MQTKRYAPICRVDQGAFGVVVKARAVEDGRMVAVKQIMLKRDQKSLLDVYREINALRNVDHENIVELRDVVFGSHDVSLVFEYVESTLKAVILDVRRPRNDDLTRFFFVQLLRGIDHLHELHIMHRDIKPENVLVSSSGEVKLADFGLACLYVPADEGRTYSHEVATRWYRAPELLFGAVRYTPAVDLWAFGCVLAEFLNGAPFFEGANDIEQIGRVFGVLGTPTEDSWPDWKRLPDGGKMHFEERPPVADWSTVVAADHRDLLAVLQSVLRLNPASRPTAAECLEAAFFRTPVDLPPAYKPPEWEKLRTDSDLVYRVELDESALSNFPLNDSL